MLELTKKHHTSDVTEICLRVPTKDAQQVFEATKQFLLLAGLPVQETNEQGEPLYTLDEVFPDSHPGVALKGYRLREGVTQKALAKQLEISPSNLSDMEHGRRPISKAMAKRIEKVTGIGYKVFL